MAKDENVNVNENYCQWKWADISGDKRLLGLWSLIDSRVVYERKDANLDTSTYHEVFSTDPIAYDVLSGIIKKNVNADKILVHRSNKGASNRQHTSDIQKTLAEVTNPQLIVHAGSHFCVIIADASYGIDVWVWNLISCL